MRPIATPSIRRNHVRRDSESATPEPPENTKATAGNGGESQNIKASDLVSLSLTDGTDIGAQLGRLEGTLDRILHSLAHSAGAL